ncbi:hypothetical protein DCS_00510 [Drechmeria coniospora]|uniref:Uncharacterized protein n=1 Tax=Drechmeria coniospora TaxID=98403 RepID=A0A151GQL7_DRECN|nr:hypothetical protein DCS_00510 [Drechmeria coniospora]KYK59380.1 hypothetical protein DCS_00510 [Drechmeria coniospora]
MKVSLTTTPLLVATALAMPTNEAEKKFKRVQLADPQNWIPGPRIYPQGIMSIWSNDTADFTANEWPKYIMSKCRENARCTSFQTHQRSSPLFLVSAAWQPFDLDD